MREIEFRIWNKMRNEYITNSTGDLALDLQNGNVLYGILGHEDNLVNITGNVLIEQYTGIKDKNGKKIFEGDIVHFEDCEYKIGAIHFAIAEFKGTVEHLEGGWLVNNVFGGEINERNNPINQ